MAIRHPAWNWSRSSQDLSLSGAGKAVAPPTFIDMSGQPFNTVFPTDYRFWELLNEVVQQEPAESLDPVTLGFFQSVGIERQALRTLMPA